MRDFWILFRTSLINNFSLNRLKKKFGNKNGFLRIGIPILTALLALGFFALIVFYIHTFSSLFLAANRPEGILYLGAALGGLFSLISTISKANAYLFESKDYDMLMSLPIKTKVIVASKLASLLFLNYLSFGAVFLPSIGIYAYYMSPSVLYYLFALVLFLVGPLLIIIICSAFSYLLGWVLSKFKHKNIIQTVAMLIVFLGVMYLSFTLNDMSGLEPGEDSEVIQQIVDSMIRTFRNIYYPSTWVVDSLVNSNWISFALYLGISLVPFALFIWVVGKNFAKANARARQTYRVQNFKLKEQQTSSQMKALVSMEFRRYFSNASVVLNTIVGPIVGTIFTVGILFSPQMITGDASIGLDTMPTSFVVALALGMSVMMNGMMSTTASSISLEGKQFWLLKTFPVKVEMIFLSKILLNLLIALPFAVINGIMVGIVLQPEIYEVLVVILIPIMINLLIGVFGLYINLIFPKFDWAVAMKVVKQSLSVGFVMLIGFLTTIGLVALFLFTVPLGFGIAYAIIIGVLLLLLTGATALLLTNGKRRFQKLNG